MAAHRQGGEGQKASPASDRGVGEFSGAAAKGYTALDINAVGANFPAIQDILKYVVDKGKSQVTSKDKVGENFYDRAVLNAVLVA